MCSPLGRALLSQAEQSGSLAASDAARASAWSGKRPGGGSEGAEASERSAKSQRLDRDTPPPAPAVFKFLAPEALSNALEAFSAIIGEAAGGELEVTPATDLFPGRSPPCRTACLISDSKDSIMAGMRKVLNIVAQCGDCSSSRPGEFHFTSLMPAKSCAMLIGVKGQNIKDLQKTSGAHVHVEGEAVGFNPGSGPGGDKLCMIKGNYVGIENALTRLVECTLEFQDQPWFPEWVVRTNSDRKEDRRDDNGGGSGKSAKIAPAAKATSAAPDPGASAASAGGMMPEMAMMANMANMANMCNMMMMPMMGMGGMGGMMPMMGMGGMGMGGMGMGGMGMMPMMGMGMPGMMGGGSTDASGMGASPGADASGAGAAGAPGGAGGGGAFGAGAGGPPAMASSSGSSGNSNIPAGIMARSAKGMLQAAGRRPRGPGASWQMPPRPPAPPAPPALPRLRPAATEAVKLRPAWPGKAWEYAAPGEYAAPAEEDAAESMADASWNASWQNPAEWAGAAAAVEDEAYPSAEGEGGQEPALEAAENPPDFDEENCTEDQLAQRVAQQREEIERLRRGLSSKIHLPGR